MIHHPDLMPYLQRAEDHVRNARQSWDATDISRCIDCVEYLRQAAGEIQMAQSVASGRGVQPGGPAAKAKERLHRLHGEVNRLGRLVDAAIAFHRGLALHAGVEEVVASEGNG